MPYDCTIGLIFIGIGEVTAVDMARRKTSFRLDDRILEAIGKASTATGHSRNAWLEHHLFNFLKDSGYISENEQPLGETRGGDRTSSEGNDND